MFLKLLACTLFSVDCFRIISDNNFGSVNLTLKPISLESLDFTLCGRFKTKQFITKRNPRQTIFSGFQSLVALDCDDSEFQCLKSQRQIGNFWKLKHTFGIYDLGFKTVTFKSWTPGRWHSFCIRIDNSTSTLMFNLSNGENFENKYNGKHKIQKPFLFMNNKQKTYPFHGSMTDINVWNYSISNEEIQKWMNCEKSLEKGKIFKWNNLSDPDYENVIIDGAKVHFESKEKICMENKYDERLIVGNQNYTFSETYTFCRSLGSMAIASNNQTTNQMVDAMERFKCDRFGAFTGHTDIEEEGHFVEVETGKKMIFTNWKNNEPNNWLGRENCVMLQRKNSKMYDAPCSYKKLCQVCNVSEVRVSMIFMISRIV